jgi:DNA mismatch endonuclease (patch repair protein)
MRERAPARRRKPKWYENPSARKSCAGSSPAARTSKEYAIIGVKARNRMDTLTKTERSERMAKIRSKNTQPELRVRRVVYQLGYRYRLHRQDLPGCPDLVFPSRRKIVFVHGCFWHGHQDCKVANNPKTRRSFWSAKFKRNRTRDARSQKALTRDGWQVFTVWECETKNTIVLESLLSRFLGPVKDARPRERYVK